MELSIPSMCSLGNESLYNLYLNMTGSDEEARENFTFLDFTDYHASACSQRQFDLVVSWLVPIIFTIIVVLGVIGNILVLVVVLFGQQMRNTTNILILVSAREFKLFFFFFFLVFPSALTLGT